MLVTSKTFMGSRHLNCSHINITDKATISKLITPAWEFMNAAYEFVPGGFQSFDDPVDMEDSSLLWYVVYDGEAPEPEDIDFGKVYVVIVFKRKFGLKGVAMGKNRLPGSLIRQYPDYKQRQMDAITAAYKKSMKIGWMEVSDRPEQIYLSLGAKKIPAQDLMNAGVFKGKEVRILDDGYHYVRKIGGDWHTKIAVGSGFRG